MGVGISPANTLDVPLYNQIRDKALAHFKKIDTIIQNEESKRMTETIFIEYQTLIMNQISTVGPEKLQIEDMICSVPKRIEEDPVEESFIMEVDSALKINLQKLINTLSRSASATLEKALQSQELLLKKLDNLKTKIISEDPKCCTKLDLLAETENLN